MKQEKEFDRSICFTFYKDFHEQIMDVKRDFGLEEAFEVYEAIANYGLFGTEIEKGRIRTLVSNSTISKIENSQENRAKWFNGENFEQTKVVAEYMRDHPNASQRAIASATGTGKTKVGKVQKNIRESGFDNIQDYLNYIVYPNLNNNIVTEGETDHRDQSVISGSQTKTATPQTESSTPTPSTTQTELTWEEYTLLMDTWESSQGTGKSPTKIANELGLDRKLCNKAINEYKHNNYTRKEKSSVTIKEIPLINGNYTNKTKDDLFNNATNDGKSSVEDINWKSLENGYIQYGIPPFEAKKLINEFKSRLKILNTKTSVLENLDENYNCI